MEYGWEAAVIKNYLFLLLKQKTSFQGGPWQATREWVSTATRFPQQSHQKAGELSPGRGKYRSALGRCFQFCCKLPLLEETLDCLTLWVSHPAFLGFRWIRRAQLQITNYQTGNSGFFFPQLFPFPFQLTE